MLRFGKEGFGAMADSRVCRDAGRQKIWENPH
jgi:hypothetical protein